MQEFVVGTRGSVTEVAIRTLIQYDVANKLKRGVIFSATGLPTEIQIESQTIARTPAIYTVKLVEMVPWYAAQLGASSDEIVDTLSQVARREFTIGFVDHYRYNPPVELSLRAREEVQRELEKVTLEIVMMGKHLTFWMAPIVYPTEEAEKREKVIRLFGDTDVKSALLES